MSVSDLTITAVQSLLVRSTTADDISPDAVIDSGAERRPDVPRVGRKLRLTPEVQETVVASIREGSFAWIAARAAGISESTFYRWLDLGEQGIEPFREFREQVEAAHAQARSSAEAEVRRTNPLAWLRFGPGRERAGRPGWTEDRQQIQVGVGVQVNTATVLSEQEVDAIWAEISARRHPGEERPRITASDQASEAFASAPSAS